MARRFEDRLILVTGGADGLGRAIALAFAGEGARIALLDINEVGMVETTAQIEALGSRAWSYRVDVSDEAGIVAFGERFCAEHPKLDALINNAGLAYGEIATGFADLSQEKWLRYFSINTVSPLLIAKAVRPALAASGRGAIVNQSSMASFTPATAYGITKASLNAVTFGMANLFAADGIRVNAVAPGIMETPASKNSLPDETYQRVQGMQLLKLHGTAEDIANLHLFLCSDDARFITNELMSCDAGNRLRGWRM